MADKIFVDGFMSQEIPDTAPDFILGKASVKIDALIAFLEDNKEYAVNGFLNFTTLRSKSSGKRYTELDLYQYNKNQEDLAKAEMEGIDEAAHSQPDTLTSPGVDGEVIDVQDIPF